MNIIKINTTKGNLLLGLALILCVNGKISGSGVPTSQPTLAAACSTVARCKITNGQFFQDALTNALNLIDAHGATFPQPSDDATKFISAVDGWQQPIKQAQSAIFMDACYETDNETQTLFSKLVMLEFLPQAKAGLQLKQQLTGLDATAKNNQWKKFVEDSKALGQASTQKPLDIYQLIEAHPELAKRAWPASCSLNPRFKAAFQKANTKQQ